MPAPPRKTFWVPVSRALRDRELRSLPAFPLGAWRGTLSPSGRTGESSDGGRYNNFLLICGPDAVGYS
jgi:hypothetical protein